MASTKSSGDMNVRLFGILTHFCFRANRSVEDLVSGLVHGRMTLAPPTPWRGGRVGLGEGHLLLSSRILIPAQ
jgi:hypothetical protein